MWPHHNPTCYFYTSLTYAGVFPIFVFTNLGTPLLRMTLKTLWKFYDPSKLPRICDPFEIFRPSICFRLLIFYHQSKLMKHILMYSYFLHRKIVNFDHSYRRDFAIFCLFKVGRDPPLHLTLSIMKWEWHVHWIMNI